MRLRIPRGRPSPPALRPARHMLTVADMAGMGQVDPGERAKKLAAKGPPAIYFWLGLGAVALFLAGFFGTRR